jgi:MFS transporter, MHS family, dicarboxylic acid transporter PcaT
LRPPAAVSNSIRRPPEAGSDQRRRVGAIIAASSGNLVEWFDFCIYAFCAIHSVPPCSPQADPTAQLLNTAEVFAAGLLMRPSISP